MDMLRIVAQSWPLAAVAISFIAFVGVYALFSRAARREDERVRMFRIENRSRDS
jgi:cbb3-type cytochrome oxidase subunit 3